MRTKHGQLRLLTPRRSLLIALAFMLAFSLLLPSLSLAQIGTTPPGDLGDAPDSTNHFGAPMKAYPAVLARYPTVFDPATGAPPGPLHINPTGNGWLGAAVSKEADADLLPDADGVTNIDPPTDTPNRDRFDDGIAPLSTTGIALPQCQRTQFRFIVTGAPVVTAPTGVVNVWFDWNRDGDWEDVFTCASPTGALVRVPEWAVQNQVVNIVPGSAVWATTPFVSFHPAGNSNIWMRINLAEARAPLNPLTNLADGRGPPNGYRFGETEDYFTIFSGGIVYKPT
jgi:hypothetical protein